MCLGQNRHYKVHSSPREPGEMAHSNLSAEDENQSKTNMIQNPSKFVRPPIFSTCNASGQPMSQERADRAVYLDRNSSSNGHKLSPEATEDTESFSVRDLNTDSKPSRCPKSEYMQLRKQQQQGV